MPVPATTGSLKTRIEDMEIGDYIACNYQASSNDQGSLYGLGVDYLKEEIPLEGAQNPDGLFYLVKVGRGKLIADRVVQHSITETALKDLDYNRHMVLISSNSEGTNGTGLGIKDFSVAISPDLRVVARSITASPYLELYILENYELTKMAPLIDYPTSQVTSLYFTKDGSSLVVSANNSIKSLYFYRRYGDQFVLDTTINHSFPIYNMSHSPDDKYLILLDGSSAGASVYEIINGELSIIPQTDSVSRNGDSIVRVIPNRDMIAIMNVYDLNLYEFKNGIIGDLIESINTRFYSGRYYETGTDHSLDVSPDGKYIATGTGRTTVDRYKYKYQQARIYDIDKKQWRNVSHVFSYDTWVYGKVRVQFLSNDELLITIGGVPHTYLLDDISITGTLTNRASHSTDNDYLYVRGLDIFINSYTNSTLRVLGSFREQVVYPSGGSMYSTEKRGPTTSSLLFGSYPTNNDWDKLILNFPQENIQEGKTIEDIFHIEKCRTWVRDTSPTSISTASQRNARPGTDKSFDVLSYNSAYEDVGFRPMIEYNE